MTELQPLHILFLSNHNTVRSLMAEAVLNHMGEQRFCAHSAGCQPSPDGAPHPLLLQTLQSANIRTDGLRSKSWDVFALAEAPHMDLVITLCDEAAAEVCPVWPGHPATAHWGYPDPSEGDADDAQKLEAFRHTLHAIRRRLDFLVNLPPAGLDKLMLQTQARDLARS